MANYVDMIVLGRIGCSADLDAERTGAGNRQWTGADRAGAFDKQLTLIEIEAAAERATAGEAQSTRADFGDREVSADAAVEREGSTALRDTDRRVAGQRGPVYCRECRGSGSRIYECASACDSRS